MFGGVRSGLMGTQMPQTYGPPQPPGIPGFGGPPSNPSAGFTGMGPESDKLFDPTGGQAMWDAQNQPMMGFGVS